MKEGPVSFPPEMPLIHHVPDWTRIVLTLQSCLLCLLLGAPLEPDGGEPPGHAEHALELRRRGPPPRQTTAGGRVAVVLGVAPLDVLVVGVVVRVPGVAAAVARQLLGDDHVLVRALLQGAPSGCALPFVDLKTKLLPQYQTNMHLPNLRSTKCSVQPDGPLCIYLKWIKLPVLQKYFFYTFCLDDR